MEKIDNHAASHDVALREGAPPIPRPIDHSRHTSSTNNGPERSSNEAWTSAISRLQAQVSYNTGMLESHRRQFTDIEAALSRLHQEMANMLGMIENVRGEVRSRPANQEPSRLDPADVDVLTTQLQRLTNKLNEVDGLTLQVDMMKNRMKRLEEGPPLISTPNHRPAASARREPPSHEVAPPPQQPHGPPIPHHPAQRPLPPAQHPPLPPMRTGSIPSPQANRPASFPAPHVLESQGVHSQRPSSESRPFSGEPTSAPHPPPGPPGPPGAPGPGYRPGEPLPPPSAISGWRPAEPYQPPGLSPANAPATLRAHPMEPDSQSGHTSGWATVNTNTAIKRPPEEGRSPYGSPLVDSSKRPKLAPLMPNMPRSSYGDESYVPSQSTYQSVPSNPSDGSQQPRSRAPSDGSQPQSHPTPASTLQHSFRFITSTQQADSQESWRPESQREPPPQAQGSGRGSRGGRGRGRGRGGRGRGANHAHAGHAEAQEMGTTPEWERPDWSGGRASPNGYHNQVQHPHSPRLASRGGIVRRADAHVAGPMERHAEYPATPTQAPPPDPYAAPPDVAMSSSGKKTRTKPIRNAEGILIRKDGRPDMRSVSSANNLRKVHAKKEAERAEMEGWTPTSDVRSLSQNTANSFLEDGDGITRSGTPTSAAAGDNDISDDPPDNSQERQHELMSRLITQGQGGMDGRRVAEQFFPRHQDDPLAGAPPHMKQERDSEMESRSREQSSQAADVVMKEASEAPADEQQQQQQKQQTEQDTTASEAKAQEASPAPSKNGSNIVVQPAAAAAG